MSSAYLLVSHGSKDSRPNLAIEELARLLFEKLTAGKDPEKHLVGVGTLEFNSQSLSGQIKDFAQRAVVCDCKSIQVIPLFLLPGVHLMSDLPKEVKLAEDSLGNDHPIKIKPYLGSHAMMWKLLALGMAQISAEAFILLAHGSRRANSHHPVETIANRLGAFSAYWSIPPSLEARVIDLVSAGYQHIGILPYFLFSGGITDEIVITVERLTLKFPEIKLELASPLGVTPQLVDIIWDLATQEE
ncbi:sirohydrochlorin chelatase [Cylindrospermopsis raciborskii LB2897]|nr:sirohydrochlorin chelatase [Cylindrospermopsis raciborskii LB2897]